MATWGWTPEVVLVESIAFDVRQSVVTPQARHVGQPVGDGVRAFRLQYGIVSSSDLAGMAAFYTARRGPFESFGWIHPNDNRAYQVRFDSALRVELFTAQHWRTGADIVLEVAE